jgi:hypothetical protein
LRSSGIYFVDSLQDRRTANAGVREVESRLGDDASILQQADRRKYWRAVTGTNRRTGGVRDGADGAGRRFCLGGMVVNGLRRRCPQHQGQTEPRRPSQPQAHLFVEKPANDLMDADFLFQN